MNKKTVIKSTTKGRASFPKRVPQTKRINSKLDRMGEVIREARLNQGLTQEELAELIDVTPAYIGHIERNQRNFSLELLVKLTTELGIDMNYMFSDTIPTDEERILAEIKQLISGKPLHIQEAVLDIIRTASKHF